MKQLFAILLLTCFLTTGCDEVILHDLNEFQANKVLLLLSSKDIDITKEQHGKGWRIVVASEDVNRALKLLDKNRVMTRALNRAVVEPTTLLSSREERAFNLGRRLGLPLEQTLEAVPGVLEARVHMSLPKPNSWQSKETMGFESVSVLLLVEPEAHVAQQAVKKLVAGAAGCAEDRIAVVVLSSTGKSPLGSLPMESPSMELSREFRRSGVSLVPHSRNAISPSWLLMGLAPAVIFCAALLYLFRARWGFVSLAKHRSSQRLMPEDIFHA
jgi:type III secretion protein J